MRNIQTTLAAAAARGALPGDKRAVTAVEYGIVAAFLCLSLLGVFTRFGGVLTAMFNATANGL